MRFLYRTFWGEQGRFSFKRSWIDINGLSPDDHIARQIAKNGSFYESELLEYLNIRIPHGGIYIDVGANIGNHSVFFGKFLADMVLCFEPSDQLRPILERNLTVNHVRDYRIYGCALGASEKKGRLIIPQASALNAGMTRVEEISADTRAEADGLVEIRALDGIMAELCRDGVDLPVRLIKIDVEGMELEVLKGAAQVLRQHQPQLVVEAATDMEKQRLDRHLSGLGYEPVRCFGATPTYHYLNPEVHRRPPLSRLYRLVRGIKGR